MVNPDDVKQAIVIRKDLKMRKGKIASQAAHASMAAVLNRAGLKHPQSDKLVIDMTPEMKAWVTGIFTKICVAVDSEEELLKIHNQAEEAGLACSLIRDAGLTEFDGVPTYTAVAIGPNKNIDIDKITRGLKLL